MREEGKHVAAGAPTSRSHSSFVRIALVVAIVLVICAVAGAFAFHNYQMSAPREDTSSSNHGSSDSNPVTPSQSSTGSSGNESTPDSQSQDNQDEISVPGGMTEGGDTVPDQPGDDESTAIFPDDGTHSSSGQSGSGSTSGDSSTLSGNYSRSVPLG